MWWAEEAWERPRHGVGRNLVGRLSTLASSAGGQYHHVRIVLIVVIDGRRGAAATAGVGAGERVGHEPLQLLPAALYNQGGLYAIAFTDDHYPVQSAFSLLNKGASRKTVIGWLYSRTS